MAMAYHLKFLPPKDWSSDLSNPCKYLVDMTILVLELKTIKETIATRILKFTMKKNIM